MHAPRAEATRDTSFLEKIVFGALLVMLALAPQEISGFWPGTYDYGPQTFWSLGTAAVCLLLSISHAPTKRLDAITWLLCGFLLWSCASIFGSVYRHDSFLEVARVGTGLAWFFIARTLWTPERTVWMVLALVVGVAGPCILAVQNFLVTHNPRQFGPFDNTNWFANAIAIALPFSLALPILLRRVARAFFAPAWALFGILSIGLVITSSKGGFLAALAGILTFSIAVLFAKKGAIKRVLKQNLVVFLVAGLFIGGVGATVAVKTVLPRLVAAREGDNSTLFRLYTWRGTVQMAKSRPLFGWGAGTFSSAYPRFAIVGYTRHAHQSWLQIAAENGLPALLLLIVACLCALRSGWKRLQSTQWPLAAGALGGIVAFATHGLTDSGWCVPSILFLTLITLALCSVDATETPSIVSQKSSINFGWLGATLLLALGGYFGQKATAGEIARDESEQFLQNGGASAAQEKARESVEADPEGARGYLMLARAQNAARQSDVATLRRAVAVAPTKGALWANLAWSLSQHGGSNAEILSIWQRAVECDPNSTDLLLQRAEWRRKNGDLKGAQADLGAILKLWDAPYGRYPASTEFVELDFARALVALSEINRKAVSKAQIEHALSDIARARQNAERVREITAASNEWSNLRPPQDLDNLEAALSALK